MPTISVATGSSELVEEPPTPFDDVAVLAVLGDLSLPKEYVRLSLQNVFRSATRYLNYGEDDYMHGLPSEAQGVSETYPYNQDVIDLVQSFHPGEVVIHETLTYGTLDPEHYIFTKMQNHYDWNSETNYIVIDGNTRVYDMYSQDSLTGEFTVYPVVGSSFTYVDNIVDEDYYALTYHLASEPNRVRYWYYNPNNNVYPQLALVSALPTTYSSLFYPIVALRVGGENIQDTAGTERTQVTEMLYKLELSLEDLTDSFEESDDIDKIEDVFLEFSADIYDTAPSVVRYAYDFFKYLQSQSLQDKADFDATGNRLTPSPTVLPVDSNGLTNPADEIPIQHNTFILEEGAYKKTLKYYYINSVLYTGVLTSDYNTSLITRTPLSVSEYVNDGWATSVEYTRNSVVYRKQISPTQYERMEVYGLSVDTEMSYYKHGSNTGTKFTNISSEVLNDDGTSNIRIPISHELIKDMLLKDRIDLLYRSMSLAINVVQRTYTSGWKTFIAAVFPPIMALFKFISLVIPIMGAAVQGLTAAVIALVNFMVNSYVYDSVFKFLIEKVDGVLGQLLAVALSVYKGQGVLDITNLDAAMFGDILLDAVSAVTKIKQIGLASDHRALIRDYEDFSTEYKDRLDEQEERLESVSYGIDGLVDTLYGGYEVNIPYETPSDFYTRTIYNRNPVLASNNYATNFLVQSRTLPTL